MKENGNANAEIHWLVRPSTIKLLWFIMIIILAITVISQIFSHIHGHFGIDEWFGFNAWYGFLACVGMVFGAKLLSIFIKRKDTYYDD